MKVEYSNRAAADLRSIAIYYARSGDQRPAEMIAARVREVVARIADVPESGRRVEQRPGVRVVPLLRYRYLIFYKIIDEETIRILHIRHTSRRPWTG